MPQENTNIRERDRTDYASPDKYRVVLHNDDFTPMNFVVELIMIVFFKSELEANQLMLKVHHEGKAVVGAYSFDIARSKADRAIQIARSNGYPLRITVEKC